MCRSSTLRGWFCWGFSCLCCWSCSSGLCCFCSLILLFCCCCAGEWVFGRFGWCSCLLLGLLLCSFEWVRRCSLLRRIDWALSWFDHWRLSFYCLLPICCIIHQRCQPFWSLDDLETSLIWVFLFGLWQLSSVQSQDVNHDLAISLFSLFRWAWPLTSISA